MDLKKLDAHNNNVLVRFCRPSALALVVVIASSCSGPSEVATVGLPDRSSTACEYIGGQANVLGPAESAFACRGKALLSGGELVGVAKADKDGTYEVFNASTADGQVKRAPTKLVGNVRLIATDSGILAASTKGSDVLWSAHKADLSLLGEGQATAAGGEILDMEVVPVGAELAPCGGPVSAPGDGKEDAAGVEEPKDDEGAPSAAPEGGARTLLLLLTAKGVEVVTIGLDGHQVSTRSLLGFPEMPYCSELRAEAAGNKLSFAVKCLDVLPKAVAPNESGIPTVSEFEYEEEVPPATEIAVSASCVGGGEATIGEPAADAEAAPSYALKSYLKEQLPRPAGHRANMLAAVDLGDQRVFALACVGPDDGPVEMQASVLTCPERP